MIFRLLHANRGCSPFYSFSGTTWKVIEDIIQSGKRCLMDIDMVRIVHIEYISWFSD